MHPLKLIILAILLLAVLRHVILAARRPGWSAILPPLALTLSVLHFVTVGTDIEMIPAFLLALFATIGVVWEFLARTRQRTRAWPPTLVTATRVASTSAVIALFSLAVLATFVWSKSDPLIREPESLAIAPVVTTRESAYTVSRVAYMPRPTVVAEHSYLRTPRDLAFNPRVEGQLWIVNGDDNSVAIIHDAHTEQPSIEYRRDGHAAHFMHRPSAIAFGSANSTIGVSGTFATAQESRDDAIPFLARNFMGPTLFSSDLAVFAHHPGPGRSGSHLDMLHESPLAMGIAWERDHVYWVFGGYLGNIVRYDFVEDHGVGQHDHSNGIIRHYGQDVVKRVPGVPSHLALHRPTATLFIADTGNRRILALDITSGQLGDMGPGWEEGVDTRQVDGALYTEFVPAGTLELPSGLELYGDLLYVSDHASGLIHVFDLAGNPVTIFDTGLGQGALMGMTFGPEQMLYFVDAAANRILRLDTAARVDVAQNRGQRQMTATPAQNTRNRHTHHGQ